MRWLAALLSLLCMTLCGSMPLAKEGNTPSQRNLGGWGGGNYGGGYSGGARGGRRRVGRYAEGFDHKVKDIHEHGYTIKYGNRYGAKSGYRYAGGKGSKYAGGKGGKYGGGKGGKHAAKGMKVFHDKRNHGGNHGYHMVRVKTIRIRGKSQHVAGAYNFGGKHNHGYSGKYGKGLYGGKVYGGGHKSHGGNKVFGGYGWRKEKGHEEGHIIKLVHIKGEHTRYDNGRGRGGYRGYRRHGGGYGGGYGYPGYGYGGYGGKRKLMEYVPESWTSDASDEMTPSSSSFGSASPTFGLYQPNLRGNILGANDEAMPCHTDNTDISYFFMGYGYGGN
ncbi:unnamed protein product [Chrysoparadoxa australica]